MRVIPARSANILAVILRRRRASLIFSPTRDNNASSVGDKPYKNLRLVSPTITTDFYTIKLKYDQACEFFYGRTKYDFQKGSLVFVAPQQRIEWDMKRHKIKQDGFILTIHKDYLRGTDIERKFRKASFFSYAVHEALHFSPKEENTIKQIILSIHEEYQGNIDNYSKDIILAQLASLLRYSVRFYNRQFINRKEMNSHISAKFNDALNEYFETTYHHERKLPNIEMIARKMEVSSRYLTDTLKAETGKTAIEHLHLYLVEEAKTMLLDPSWSISQVAYQLGFEYPQYFSRVFKKKTGLSPKEYQRQYR